MIVPIVEKDVYESPGDSYIYILPDGRAWLVRSAENGDPQHNERAESWLLEEPIDLPPHALVGRFFNTETEGIATRYHMDQWLTDLTTRDLAVGVDGECIDTYCPYDHVVVEHVEGKNSQERRRANPQRDRPSSPENVEEPT